MFCSKFFSNEQTYSWERSQLFGLSRHPKVVTAVGLAETSAQAAATTQAQKNSDIEAVLDANHKRMSFYGNDKDTIYRGDLL